MKSNKNKEMKTNKRGSKKSKKNDLIDEPSVTAPVVQENILLGIYNLNYSNFSYNLNSLSLHSFNLSVGPHSLFECADLKLGRCIRYGLIGKNGSGKSSLIKQFTHLCSDEKLRVLYVEQELILDERNPVDYIIDSNTKVKLYQDEVNKIQVLIDNTPDDSPELSKLFEQLDEAQSIIFDHDQELRLVNKILKGLGFTNDDLVKESRLFSGGWQMRLSLARSLYLEPDMLIMDEPTNHLDLEAIIWLSDYLLKWKKIVLIVSHNIGFLNDTCNCILNVENKKVCSYTGNYDAFKKTHAKKLKEESKIWEKYDKEYERRKKTNKYSKEAMKEWAKENEVPRPPKENDINIAFPSDMIPIHGPLIQFNNVSFNYGSKKILDNVSFGLSMKDKITLVGLNGSGKSTIIKLIMSAIYPDQNAIRPDDGEVLVNNSIRIGYYNQHFDQHLPMDQTPVDYLRDFVNYRSVELTRKHLGNIRLDPGAHNKLIGELSGGQKARVAIAKLILENPHVILFDEPTNHLDIETVEALIDALGTYNGGILLITHEPELIECVTPNIWYLDATQHKINNTIKNFDQYCNLILSS